MQSDQIRFNKIIVVESLASGELKTGTSLVDNVLRPAVENSGYADLSISLEEPKSGSEVVRILRDAADEAGRGVSPIIHLEAHGNQDVLGLADGSQIPWEDLAEYVREINVRTRLNTLVTIGACSGASFAKVATPPGHAAFLCLLAPLTTLLDTEVEACFSAFYRELLESKDMKHAVDAVVAAYPKISINDGAYTVRSLFQIGYQLFASENMRPEQVEAYEADLIRQIRDDGEPEYRSMPEEELRALFNAQSIRRFEEFRDEFFMADLYPENRERFGLSALQGAA